LIRIYLLLIKLLHREIVNSKRLWRMQWIRELRKFQSKKCLFQMKKKVNKNSYTKVGWSYLRYLLLKTQFLRYLETVKKILRVNLNRCFLSIRASQLSDNIFFKMGLIKTNYRTHQNTAVICSKKLSRSNHR
jgi:hypothetical protein